MKTSDFYFDLPDELIAQKPLEKRSDSKLMVCHRDTGLIEHKHFHDLIDYLTPEDVLIVNQTKVIPARLIGEKVESGIKVEILLLRQVEKDLWEAIVRPGRRLKLGAKCSFGQGMLKATIEQVLPDIGGRLVRFQYQGIFENLLDILGEMPLPPYIIEKLEDKNRYQTVYAKQKGSAAAPTAGLHFTKDLLERISAKSIVTVPLLLHVGLGTFRPVKAPTLEEHSMHSEYFEISKRTAQQINKAKQTGKKRLCVGTTSLRALESSVNKDGEIYSNKGFTDIFITPGKKILSIDALITNFHLPESTLLMMISAFWDRDSVLEAYKIAIKERYRFFSFGDAMLII